MCCRIMYLHIGRDWMIPYKAIIALFPYSILTQSPEFRHLFHSQRVQGRVFGQWEEAKTILLTDNDIFLSSISPHTLLHRAGRYHYKFN